jgi:hypothetical protein
MTGEGVWVRCIRCEQVFFQPSPNRQERPRPETSPDSGLLDRFETMGEEPWQGETAVEIQGEDELPSTTKTASSRRSVWILGAILVVLLCIGAFLYLYPSAIDTIMGKALQVYPAITGLLSGESPAKAIGPAQVKIVDLKQRLVENAVMGPIRVVEGMAVNASSAPMTRIKVKAELYDVIGTRVMEGSSYCGNLLTDYELKTAEEAFMIKKMSTPQGTDISNERIVPNSMVPFMILFLREPPGVVKTLVMPVEAERLLP